MVVSVISGNAFGRSWIMRSAQAHGLDFSFRTSSLARARAFSRACRCRRRCRLQRRAELPTRPHTRHRSILAGGAVDGPMPHRRPGTIKDSVKVSSSRQARRGATIAATSSPRPQPDGYTCSWPRRPTRSARLDPSSRSTCRRLRAGFADRARAGVLVVNPSFRARTLPGVHWPT